LIEGSWFKVRGDYITVHNLPQRLSGGAVTLKAPFKVGLSTKTLDDWHPLSEVSTRKPCAVGEVSVWFPVSGKATFVQTGCVGVDRVEVPLCALLCDMAGFALRPNALRDYGDNLTNSLIHGSYKDAVSVLERRAF